MIFCSGGTRLTIIGCSSMALYSLACQRTMDPSMLTTSMSQLLTRIMLLTYPSLCSPGKIHEHEVAASVHSVFPLIAAALLALFGLSLEQPRMDVDHPLGMSNNAVYKTNFRTPVLGTLKNRMRSLTARLENGHCSITVANHQLITVIRFIAQSYTHP